MPHHAVQHCNANGILTVLKHSILLACKFCGRFCYHLILYAVGVRQLNKRAWHVHSILKFTLPEDDEREENKELCSERAKKAVGVTWMVDDGILKYLLCIRRDTQ